MSKCKKILKTIKLKSEEFGEKNQIKLKISLLSYVSSDETMLK